MRNEIRPAVAFSIMLLALSVGGSATSQAPTEFKLTASDAAAEDYFGFSVAVSGDTALVGAWNEGNTGGAAQDGPGAAYVFVRNGTSWIQQQKLVASDAAAGDLFGFSVAVTGDTALVGSPFRGSGSAYVFVRSGMSWIQQQKLTASDAAAEDQFGESVALSGDTALIGALFDDDAGSASGSVYVFARNGTGWIQQQKLVASDAAAGDFFGTSVAVSGDTAFVGSPHRGSGSAYVFVRSGTDWSQHQKLTGSDAVAGDQFGRSVAVSGDTAVFGAWQDDDAGPESGSAYVFVRSGTSWIQQQKLVASDAAAADLFGLSVAVSGGTALVGAYWDSDAGVKSGSAYAFVRSGASWTEQAKLTASDAAADDLFGFSVAVSGGTALVGAYGDNPVGVGFPFGASGSAHVYELGLATVSAFGTGCPGTLGVPVLHPLAGSLPKTGGRFDVVLANMPANKPAFLILGLSDKQWLSMSLPMSLASFGAPGCSLLVSGDFSTEVVNTAGTATQAFFIPLDPSLVGLHIYFQGYVEDPGANLFGKVVSNGLEITIGAH